MHRAGVAHESWRLTAPIGSLRSSPTVTNGQRQESDLEQLTRDVPAEAPPPSSAWPGEGIWHPALECQLPAQRTWISDTDADSAPAERGSWLNWAPRGAARRLRWVASPAV